jgi:hypothetical protein
VPKSCKKKRDVTYRKSFLKSGLIIKFFNSARPVAAYGFESWTVTNKMERALIICREKILREIWANISKCLLENRNKSRNL